MKISEIIERVDELKPNAFSDRVKLGWLNSLEGRIIQDVFMMSVVAAAEYEYKYPEGLDMIPLVRVPHNDIYGLWILAKIDEAHGEYDKFANSSEIYNAHYRSFARWFADTYEPARGHICVSAPAMILERRVDADGI